MPKKESPLRQLSIYLPDGAYEDVAFYLIEFKVHLTVTRERMTKLGDYRNKHHDKNHRISVNGNLNKYSFLITLLHELGHLVAYEKYGNRILAHGPEWKAEFGKILERFIIKKIFPHDIEKELVKTLKNPAASSCAEASLTRILKKYDPHKPGVYLLEELPDQSLFLFKNGLVYQKIKKIRTRFLCKDISSNKLFLFSPITEVQLTKQSQ
ncbi:MAG TPA: SprT-like domain-containing protein [Hanamia sp.]|jgi:predicted SprT family Zn-dependent metalloprotease|nr:SprT-like domain-containing protein [Hanamia sp.]